MLHFKVDAETRCPDAYSPVVFRCAAALPISPGWYRSLALWAVLGPASYMLMLATRPATFSAGLYQRLFIVCTWLWIVVICAGLISGSLTGGIADREARTT